MFRKIWKITIIATVLMMATAAAENEPLKTFVQNDDLTFSLMDTKEDGLFGYEWKVYLENNTDKELMYSFEDVSVNGLMADPFWATEISAGMKANKEINWTGKDFKKIGIDEVTAVEFRLRVYDSDDWMADPLMNEVFIYYPSGEENKTTFMREKKDTDQILVDNDECAITVIGYDPDDLFGYKVEVYLENKTDKNLMFSLDDASVNGYMCDPFWATSVNAGKTSFDDIIWYKSSLEEQNITEISSITLPIRVYDEEDWMADSVLEETFTLEP